MSLTLATVTTQFLERPGLSIATQKSYELTLLPLLQEYGRQPIEIVGRAAIEEYLNGLTHLAYTTHNRHQSIVQALLNFAVEQGYLKVNPIAHLRRRKPDARRGEHASDRVIRYLSAIQLQQMYEAIAPDCRLNAVVRLLHRSGARIAELLALNLEDLDLQGQRFQVVGKGNKTRWCFYSEDAALLLDKYLKYYRHPEHPALWTAQHRLSKTVVRLSYPNIHQRWRELTDPFPLIAGIRLHDLRHTFATERVGLIGIEVKTKKRHALLVCLLYRAQVKTRDYLVDLFLKRMRKIHYRARQRLVELREQHLKQTEVMLGVLAEILEVSVDNPDEQTFGLQVQALLQSHGGATELLERCQEITTYNSDNYLPLIRHFFGRYRPLLFGLVRSLELQSTSQDRSLPVALEFVLKHEQRRSKYLPSDDLDLSFISERWRRLVVEQRGEKQVLSRVHLEVCIFTYLAAELKTGDISVAGSEQYANFREQLLSWDECESQLAGYGLQSGLPVTAESFVAALKQQLTEVAQTVDQICQDGSQITINEVGAPVLKRLVAQVKPSGADELEAQIWERLPERSVLDILCNVEHWLNWTRHFGLASGSEAKLEQPTERYILAVFGYGCNLGPLEGDSTAVISPSKGIEEAMIKKELV